MKTIFLFLFLVPILFLKCQPKLESELDTAYLNAKKGLYWALANIPEKKTKTDNKLIAADKLYAEVKIRKEVDGFRFESTGYNATNEVSIKIYKSIDNLKSEGYLKEKTVEDSLPPNNKKNRKKSARE